MDESAHGGERRSRKRYMSRVRVITGIVPARFLKLPTSGAQVAHVVAMRKTCRNCRKLEEAVGSWRKLEEAGGSCRKL